MNPSSTSDGVASIESPHPLALTLSKLQATIHNKGLTHFAHIDHGAGAREAGLQMQEAHVIIFGAAKAGTPLMVANPLLAIDLPLKILVWEDADQKVWASYNTPEYLAQRHRISSELIKNISGVKSLIEAALA
jgi:uncharacterized protein (DUF302 family)